MELHRLPIDAELRPDPVDTGWVRWISRGPSTVGQVLERGRQAMLAEDEAEEYARDPLAYVRAHRPRRRLIDRLLYGRAR